MRKVRKHGVYGLFLASVGALVTFAARAQAPMSLSSGGAPGTGNCRERLGRGDGGAGQGQILH
jgi:hypothetical protein